MIHPLHQTGKVILAGAGPGDADLITLRLQKALWEAEVIITDRLVNPEIISRYAQVNAEIILAGKMGYSDTSSTQEEINELMLLHALSGKTVLRLKGGDVSLFSNLLDELLVLHINHVPFEIIPGITAGSGAAAYAGIPLTARNYSQGVQYITYHANSQFSPEKWKLLAKCGDTLVFYMASKHVLHIAARLVDQGMKPDTPIAIIEQACTVFQQVHVSTLLQCSHDFAGQSFGSPSLVMIGEVVSLYGKFSWFGNAGSKGSIFYELTKM